MSIEKWDKKFKNLSQEIEGIEDLLELAKFCVPLFVAKDGLFDQYSQEYKDSLAVKAYGHDYKTWITHLKALSEYGIGSSGFAQEDVDREFYSLDFYKAAISFLVYLQSGFNSEFNKNIPRRDLESMLSKSDSRIQVDFNIINVEEVPFVDYYIILNLFRNAQTAISKQYVDRFNFLVSEKIRIDYIHAPLREIMIYDSGAGIPKESAQKLCQDGVSSRGEIGNKGFGLYGVRELVDALRGRLRIIGRYEEGEECEIEKVYDFVHPPSFKFSSYGMNPVIEYDADPNLFPDIFNTAFYISLPNR